VALWTQSSQRIYSFGPFEFDLWTGEIRKNGTKLRVQNQPLKVLAMLLAQPGELVTREQLREGLWPKDTFVDFERGLNTAVNRLRAALDDSAENPHFVETVGSRGYRFIGAVSTKGSGKKDTNSQDPPLSSRVYEWPSDGAKRLAVESSTVDTPLDRAPVRPFSKWWNRVTVALTVILATAGSVGYIVHWAMSHGTRPNLEKIGISKLTDSGKAEDVAISPDGRYVAYLFRDGDDTSLRLRQVGEKGEAQVLVHEPQLFPGLAFSPDGNHLYFLRMTPKDPLFRDLFEVPALGGLERKVTSSVDTAVSFSPDGRQFVYESGMPHKDSVEIRIALADGSGDHLLVSIQEAFAGYLPGAAWSPDGTSIAVPVLLDHKSPGNVLEVISVANGAVRELYSGNQELGRPRWLPDGKMLIVPMADHNGRSQLWTVSYPAGTSRRLTNDLADYDPNIDTTRDGRMLATVQHTAIFNLSVSSSRDGSNGKQLTSGEQFITTAFPVNGKLAILNRADNRIWLMDADGTHPKLAADAAGGNWFTGCGRFILFVTDWSHNPGLMRVDLDGANARRLTTGSIWGETCSPDGKFVYYPEVIKPRWKIKRVPIDGGTPVDIFENPGEAMPGRVAISPDGKLLAFPYDLASTEPTLKIGVIPIGGGPLLRTFDVAGEIQGPRWSPDGRAVQYLIDKNGATNLWEQPMKGGPPHQVTNFTSGQIFDFNWTADGKQLLLCRGEVTSDIVLLSNLR
jgi:eukaryotic-like serine/threonine-protein kinase